MFDQNISFRIVKKINSIFPNLKHIRELRFEDFPDIEIWNFVRINDFVIVTFDADFADIANIKGCPPKIIWLRTGNMTTNNIVQILKKHQMIIQEFIENIEYKEIACLKIE